MTDPVKTILVSFDSDFCLETATGLCEKGLQVVCISKTQGLLGTLYSDPPEVMLVDLTGDYDKAISVVSILRGDIFFSTVPIIGLLRKIERHRVDWDNCPLDDFVALPLSVDELYQRIHLAVSRIKRVFDNNPLSRLPGNTSIQKAVNEAIGKPFAVCYLDINQFKPYNDVYGFSHGDEVLRMMARIMFNAVMESGGGFCGHIGGDDFVCIVPFERAESICKTIIYNYDKIILDLFDEKTRAQGYYISTNRKGEREQIPLLSISIAVVSTESESLDHFARVAEIAAELKAQAKLSDKSSYIIDKRKK